MLTSDMVIATWRNKVLSEINLTHLSINNVIVLQPTTTVSKVSWERDFMNLCIAVLLAMNQHGHDTTQVAGQNIVYCVCSPALVQRVLHPYAD